MLKELKIKNYVLIDSLEVSFPEGLSIITGQTGAGKSILLGALSLLLGSKADAGAVGASADNCVVEAEFEIDPGNVKAREIVEDEGGAEWDEGRLLIRRVVARSGRSRSFLNDCPVNVTVLSSLAAYLVDIHSQHQTLLLSDHQFQLSLLDNYASNNSLLEECAGAFSSVSSLKRELSELEERIRLSERDRDYNEAQLKQLVAASLKEGELSQLEEEQKTLANAEDIKENLSVVETLSMGVSDDLSLVSSLKEMRRRLDKVSSFLPAMKDLSDRIDSCRLELEDILSDVSTANASLDVSPERLELIEGRIGLIYSLLKKHGCADEAELISLRDSLSESADSFEQLYERKAEIEKEIKSAQEHYSAVSGKLHARRLEFSAPFAASITESIRNLELPFAEFAVELAPASPTSAGEDTVVFKFSANGANLQDVAKCASGGELSRIMLCLKDMMARYTNMPTMIFDEIDTGVSGSVADKMGSMICSMGAYMQVFAITHLPQVAAKGNAHYLVSKETTSGSSVSSIKKLSAEQRVMEVARMLSGSSLTDAAIENAKSLLGC